jgi:hypothetical protein
MVIDDSGTPQAPSLAPEGIFVVQLRSDSDAERQHLIGRVEHLKSGESVQFDSLAALLGFIGRHAGDRQG